MAKIIFNISVSVDGFVAGPNDEVDEVFQWYYSGSEEFKLPGMKIAFKMSKNSADLLTEHTANIGAMITGKRNFSLAKAWGGHPPLGVPHVVVTHHPSAQWEQKNSLFTFVTDGVASAVRQAKGLANGKDVCISSPNVMQQCLNEGLVDELYLDVVPVLLGKGIKLFDDTAEALHQLQIIRVINGEGVTHMVYEVMYA